MEVTIHNWIARVHGTAVAKGWWEGSNMPEPTADEILSKLMLVVSELGEATERVRAPGFAPRELWIDADKPDGFGVELADAVIRIMDLCGRLGIDLEDCIQRKADYNRTRPARHGGKRA